MYSPFYGEKFINPQSFREKIIRSGGTARINLDNLSDDQLVQLIEHYLDDNEMLIARNQAFNSAMDALEDGSFVKVFEEED